MDSHRSPFSDCPHDVGALDFDPTWLDHHNDDHLPPAPRKNVQPTTVASEKQESLKRYASLLTVSIFHPRISHNFVGVQLLFCLTFCISYSNYYLRVRVTLSLKFGPKNSDNS